MKTAPPITPVILTLNEEPNMERTLSALSWAARVVILDSGSTDRTRQIAKSFRNVAWFERPFDEHSRQWTYAVKETGVDTEWVLALDADMVVSAGLVDEMENQFFPQKFAGGVVPFTYCCGGRDLFGSLYPPDLRVFQWESVKIAQDGHTQRFSVSGPTYRFTTKIFHDDRKAVDRFVWSQLNYSRLEQSRMHQGETRGLKQALRKIGISPAFAGILGYLRAGGPLKGAAAMQYAYERMTFEAILAMRLFHEKHNATAPQIRNEK